MAHTRVQHSGLVIDLGLYYDFRHPHRWPEILEQIAWAESIGFASVWISEHHFREDGYASGTMPLAAAISQHTSTLQIGTNLVVLPVHEPIRLAEDALTVDALSGGRLRLGLVGPAVDPDGAVEHLVQMIGDAPVIDVHGWTLFPGESIDGANARLELLITKVLPKLRERLGS